MTFNCSRPGRVLLVLVSLILLGPVQAQIDVDFSTSDPGVRKAIPNWGLDTNWPSADNMKRGLGFMGTDNVNVIRVPAMVDKPVDGGLTSDQKAHLQLCLELANTASAATKWDLCAPGSDTVGSWYQTGAGTISVERWAQAMTLAQQFYNRSFWMVEPFNEPDYAAWGEGSRQNLYDIMGALQNSPAFAGAAMAGGSTMSTDRAAEWYDALGGRASIGTTHALYGTVSNYVDFIQHVADKNGVPINPEGHNVVEAIIGAEYGLKGMIWWGTAELARGNFVKASQGVRLGYAENRPNWTAAAVYRAPNGAVQGFLGSGERVGGMTTYRFHATDRDVYYDGQGPQRDYIVTIGRNQEKVVNITWGSDPQSVVGGRYVVVNGSSGLCLEVAGASTSNGAALRQNAYSGADHQLWDIASLAANGIGDLSYFLITNANSKLNADVPDWVYNNEAVIKQYGYPGNEVEHWYFEYAGNGYFYIRSRWSNKCLSVGGADQPVGAAVVQRSFAGTPDQLWRLQSPATTPIAEPLRIVSHPQSVTAAPGQTMTFAVGAVGTGRLSFQWRFNGAPIIGATGAQLALTGVQAANAGTYSVVVADAIGSATSAAATLTLKTTPDVGRLINLSIRSTAGTGDRTLISGFVVGGANGTKRVLIRGIGPTLAAFGLSGVLAAPKLDLYGGSGLLQSGSTWGGMATLNAAFAAVGAFPLDPASDDAAFLPSLGTGAYTVQLTGLGGTAGVGLIELYDATAAGTFNAETTSRLVNASARTQVGTGENVLIAGFAIGGSTARTLLIRATGPALAGYGVSGTLTAPQLDLIKDSVTLATNSGWAGDAQITAASKAVGAFPLTNPASKDSALLVTLPPGVYSAKVSGGDGGTGVALVEIYDLP